MENKNTSPAPQSASTPTPWKVMACPLHHGKHPCHDNRWIVSADAEYEFGHDPRSWGLSKGTLICEMRDHISAPAANAALIVQAVNERAALLAQNATLLAALVRLEDFTAAFPAITETPAGRAWLKQARAAIANASKGANVQ